MKALAPVAEHVRAEVALAAIDTSQVDVSRLHVDLTKLRVAGAYTDSTLVAKGWGPDLQDRPADPDAADDTGDGVPTYVRPHPGAQAEVTAMGQAMDRLREIWRNGVVEHFNDTFDKRFFRPRPSTTSPN